MPYVVVPSKIKFVGSILSEIWIIEYVNYVTMTSLTIRFLWNSNTNLPKAYLSDIPNFNLIRHKRAEIQSSEVKREL